MARQNVAAINTNRTHEGGTAAPFQSPQAALERAVTNCLLFEQTFYEGAGSIASRIAVLSAECPPEFVAALAIRTRQDLGLRHVSLWLARCLAKNTRGKIVAETIDAVIQRADELAEFLTLYWRDGRTPLSAQVKKGLARAFRKFNAYSLAKYNRDDAIKLRDVLFLVHAKPKDAEQEATWKALVGGTLPPPDTWEVALSTGTDKRETWERLLREGKLGALALLRNLRNMDSVGVDRSLVMSALVGMKPKGVLPFQFVSAARYAPQFIRGIEKAMLAALSGIDGLPGRTALVIDVSGSMDYRLSGRGEMVRLDAASALAILLSEGGDLRVWTFSQALVEIPAYRGFALVDAVSKSQPHRGTYLAGAIDTLSGAMKDFDRMIVVTDEQSHDGLAPCPVERGYLINVAPYQPGLDTSQGWTRINGFSERVVEWIGNYESATDR